MRNVVFVNRCYCSCHYSIAVFTYSRKYLCRRIPHASNGRFNPYVVTNKDAHIINGNIFSTDKKDIEKKCVRISTEAHAASSTTPHFTTVPRHFINYCFKHPGKFSCAVDCFLELRCVIFVCCGILTATHYLNIIPCMFTITKQQCSYRFGVVARTCLGLVKTTLPIVY